MEKKTFHIGFDIITNMWEHVEAFTEKEAEMILIKQASDEYHVPESQILIHCIHVQFLS